MKTMRIPFTILALLCLQPVGMALAGAEVIQENIRLPLDMTVYNECTGEDVQLSGEILETYQKVVTTPGMEAWNYHIRYQGVRGVGLTSGIQYVGSGGEHGYGSSVAGETIPYHYAAGMIYTMRLVSKSNTPDLVILYRYRLTVTPDIRWLAEIEVDKVLCR